MQEEITRVAPPQPFAARGDFVVRRGTFFEIGEYPDKQFGLTEAEADAAIACFAPIPLNVEHIPTIFDGKLGLVRRLWREGKSILAEYAIPRWLHEVTGGAAIKISSEWSRANKRPLGGAFVLHPRVADAVMQAAFREDVREEGRGGETVDSRRKGEELLPSTPPRAAYSGKTGDGRREGEVDRQTRSEGSVQGVAFALDAEVHAEGEKVRENGDVGARDCAGKECDSMTLLSGIKALFQRAGVPSEEIDAQLPVTLSGSPPFSLSADTLSGTAAGDDSRRCPVRMSADAARPYAESQKAGHVAPSSEPLPPTLDAARFAALEAELTQLRQTAQATEDQARFAADTRIIEGWVRAFQMTPAEAEQWRLIAEATPAAFAVAVPALNARATLPHLAGSTVKASDNWDADQLEALTQQKMKATGLDHTAAFKEACEENRDLARTVRLKAQEGN